MKTTMRSHRPESELKEAAENMARSITIRSTENGCSRDVTRKSTRQERARLTCVLYAALLALNESEAARSDTEIERSILSTAEYMLLVMDGAICPVPETRIDPEAHINTYDTAFIPLMNYIRAWRAVSAE